MKTTKVFRNKIFSSKVEQHKRFSLGHVESSLYNCAEAVSPKPWEFAPNVQKKFTNQYFTRRCCFPSKSCLTARMQFWQNGRKFSVKSPRFVKKFLENFLFHSFFWLRVFHRLFLCTRRTLFWKSANLFLGKVRVLFFQNPKGKI